MPVAGDDVAAGGDVVVADKSAVVVSGDVARSSAAEPEQ